MDALGLVLALAAKDLRLFFRDKVGMALGFLLPIALVAVFASVFGSFGGDDDGIPRQTLRIADEDGTEATRKLLAALNEAGTAEARHADDEGRPYTRDRLAELVNKGRVPLAIVLGDGFQSKLEKGEQLPIEIIRDPTKTIEFQIASQLLFVAVMRSAGPTLGKTMTMKGIDAWRSFAGDDAGERAKIDSAAGVLSDVIGRMVAQAGKDEAAGAAADSRPSGAGFDGLKGPAAMLGIKETIAGTSGESAGERKRIGWLAQSVAGTAVMMLLFGLTACGTTILQEREGGTLRRLLVSPAPRGAILAGKFLFTFVMGLMQVAVMFAFGGAVFGLPVLRHLPGLLVVSVATVAAATSFGILIATVGRTSKQVEGLSTLVILVMSAVGGSWFPLFLAPPWMQVAGHFTLNAWAMDGYMGVLAFGRPPGEILVPCGVLLAVAVVLSAIATLLFGRRFASAERG
jgi:ABC-2 type transport system permease protein